MSSHRHIDAAMESTSGLVPLAEIAATAAAAQQLALSPELFAEMARGATLTAHRMGVDPGREIWARLEMVARERMRPRPTRADARRVGLLALAMRDDDRGAVLRDAIEEGGYYRRMVGDEWAARLLPVRCLPRRTRCERCHGCGLLERYWLLGRPGHVAGPRQGVRCFACLGSGSHMWPGWRWERAQV